MKNSDRAPVRLAYLVTHPIQYQAPLLQRIAKEPEFHLKVFFRSDFSARKFIDPDFGTEIQWDINLLDGYDYEVLPAIRPTNRISFWMPWNYGIGKRLKIGDFDVVWIHGYASFFHLYTMIAAKFLGVKVLIRDEATFISKKRGKFKKIIKRVFFVLLNMFCDGFLAIGTMNKDYYLANGVPEKKIFEMPYAVDNHFFHDRAKRCKLSQEAMRESLELASGRAIVLFASKLTERKRPNDLLEAFSRVITGLSSRPYLLFVGDGKMRSYLERRAVELDLERDVFFLGFRNQSELPCFYDLCNVFVLPSLFEPWGLVLNEAMNSELAVIASDQVGSSLDLIHTERNGFIFRAGDVTDLALSLTKALSNPSKLHKMGQESLNIISKWGFDEDIKGLKKAVRAVLPRQQDLSANLAE